MRKLGALGFALIFIFILSACDTDTISALVGAVVETEVASYTDTPLTPTHEWVAREGAIEWNVRSTPTLSPTFTSTATITPTSTLVGCPSSPPLAIVTANSYCRSGPSTIYDKLTSFGVGMKLPLSGYYQHPGGSLWWKVIHPNTGRECWIAGILVDVCTPLSYATLLTPPPTPTQRPVQNVGGLQCNNLAKSEPACGDGLWEDVFDECDCSVLCSYFKSDTSCQAHASWFCSWNGSACVGP